MKRAFVLAIITALAVAGCTSGPQTTPTPPQTYTLSGSVTTGDGQGVEGVTVTITGPVSGTVTTDAQGRWTFAGARGVTNVAPSHPDYVFEPAFRTVTEASGAVNFVALGQTDVRLVSAEAEVWWSHGEQHRVEYVAENVGRAGQYKLEVYGLRVNVINPPWEFLGATDLLTIGAQGSEHSLHNLAFQLTLPYRYYTLRLDALVWTGSNWALTDSLEVGAY